MAEVMKINNTKYPLKYGMEFVRQIDERAGVKENIDGVKVSVGMGLGMVVSKLQMGNLAPEYIYFDIIKSATATLTQKPSDEEIEDFIYDVIFKDDESIEKYKDSFLEQFEKSRSCQRQMKMFKAETKAIEEEETNDKK